MSGANAARLAELNAMQAKQLPTPRYSLRFGMARR